MVDLSDTASTPLVRTDFSDEAGWQSLIALVRTPSADGFLSDIEVVDDARLAGIAMGDLIAHFASSKALLVVADLLAVDDNEHPLLCVDLETGQSLRVVPAELWSIENNISLANMDFAEFASAADNDGVFRGFG